jgi:hypothetical protein
MPVFFLSFRKMSTEESNKSPGTPPVDLRMEDEGHRRISADAFLKEFGENPGSTEYV